MSWAGNGHSTATRNGSSGEIHDRQPPHDLDSEAGALAAILTHPPAIADALSAGLRPQHFYDQAHRIVFAAMEEISIRGAIVDSTLLLPILRRAEDDLGTRAEALLVKLIGAPGLVANLPHYVNQVLDTARRRNFILTLNQLHIDAVGGRKTGDILETAARQIEQLRVGSKRSSPIGIATLSAEHPHLAPYIIDGVLRRGESMNFIAPPKKGKSWLGYGVMLSIDVGRYWLDTFQCCCGRTLLIDNELHPAVIASRIKTTAEAMGIQQHEYADNLDVLSLRGRLLDLNGIAMALEGIEPGTYDFILLDAFYRTFAPGVSENDNSAVAGMYNTIDGIAKRLDCAVGLIHHSSKGSQADKSIVDVGAGAGSQSRAADAHVILREHEEKGAVVLEAVVRSFAPVEPLALRWNFPLWQRDDGIDVKAIKGRLTRGEERTNDRDEEGINAIVKALETASEPLSRKHIQDLVLGCGKARSDRLLGRLESSGRLKRQSGKRHGIPCDEFWLVSRAEELVLAAGTETGTPVCDTVPVQPASQPVRALKGARRTGWQKPVRKRNANRKKKLRAQAPADSQQDDDQ